MNMKDLILNFLLQDTNINISTAQPADLPIMPTYLSNAQQLAYTLPVKLFNSQLNLILLLNVFQGHFYRSRPTAVKHRPIV